MRASKLKYLIIIISHFFCSYGFAQVTIANEIENIAYIGIDNPISVAAFDYPCGDINLVVDNGSLEKILTSCGKYSYKPSKPGAAVFKLYAKKKDQVLLFDRINFRVIYPPLPTYVFFSVQTSNEIDPITEECCASMQVKNEQKVSVENLKNPIGLGTSLLNFSYPISYKIDSYEYTIHRDNKILKKGKNIGATAGSDFLTDMQLVKANDMITFDAIICSSSFRDNILW